jgi:hypothetical protein
VTAAGTPDGAPDDPWDAGVAAGDASPGKVLLGVVAGEPATVGAGIVAAPAAGLPMLAGRGDAVGIGEAVGAGCMVGVAQAALAIRATRVHTLWPRARGRNLGTDLTVQGIPAGLNNLRSGAKGGRGPLESTPAARGKVTARGGYVNPAPGLPCFSGQPGLVGVSPDPGVGDWA